MSLSSRSVRFMVSAVLALTLTPFGVSQSFTLLDRALAEFRAGHYSSAADLFARVEAQAPRTTDALLYRAKCLVHLQDFSAAESALRAYLQSHARSSDAMYMLGFVLNRENRPAESLSSYTSAASLLRPTSDDLKIVALDYVLLHDYPDAIKWLKKAVELDPTNEDAWYFLGRAYYSESRLDEARGAFQKILELDPRNARAEDNLGLILETEGKPGDAMEAYRKAISWQDQKIADEQPYVNLGNLLAEQGHLQDAVPLLERAVALAPNDAYCHMTLGVTYRKVGEMEKARKELLKAAELAPDNPIAHYQLGRLYKDLKDLGRARQEFNRTSELQSRASSSQNQ